MMLNMLKGYMTICQNIGLCLLLLFYLMEVLIEVLPISCFLNEAGDSLHSIVDLWNENVWLASKGGGIGSYWGNFKRNR